MRKSRIFLHYFLWLTSLCGLGFLLHAYLRDGSGLDAYGDLLPQAYAVNYLMALGIVLLLYSFRHQIKSFIGFGFIAGGGLKFLIFFLYFYPVYKADQLMHKSEFAAFFVPYAICLILETLYSSKMVQSLEENDQVKS